MEHEDEIRKGAGEQPGPSKTPGKAEGGEDRPKPYPGEPGKTPGKAEGEDEEEGSGRGRMAGEEFSDPGTLRSPDPRRF